MWIGTSGYNYPEWKGSFYPADLPAAEMLPYYADRFPTVEINYTFYRMPTEKLVPGWAAATRPAADVEGAEANHARQPSEELRAARRPVLSSGGRSETSSRCLLLRFRPTPEGSAALRRVSHELPPRLCAFEPATPHGSTTGLRSGSGEIFLCVADSEKMPTPPRVTADYAYFRLRTKATRPPTSSVRQGRSREGGSVPRRLRLLARRIREGSEFAAPAGLPGRG